MGCDRTPFFEGQATVPLHSISSCFRANLALISTGEKTKYVLAENLEDPFVHPPSHRILMVMVWLAGLRSLWFLLGIGG